MPVEPLRLPVSGNRTLVFYPGGKDFPDRVRLDYDGVRQDGKLGTLQRFASFNMASTTAAVMLERTLFISSVDSQTVLASYCEWSAAAKAELDADADKPALEFKPKYELTQRQKTELREQALSYASVDSPDGFLGVLKKTNLPPDTLLEWNKEALSHLACLDLDFHNLDMAERPTEDDLDRLGRSLQPAPFVWWRTQGHGLHAMYAPIPGEEFTAPELMAVAAAELLSMPFVALRRGTVELKNSTRHPGALQGGRACGPLHAAIQDMEFVFLSRLSRAEATEAEVTEVLDVQGLKLKDRLDHSYCLLDPGHASQSLPISVMEDGLFCHSCSGRTGNGFMSWGFVRRKLGLAPEEQRALAPLQEASLNYSHVSHADYLYERLLPELPEMLRRHLYSLQLKVGPPKKKGEPPDRIRQKDARVSLAFSDFGFVRGTDCWLHRDTLLPAGRPLNAKDVAVLPSCLNPDPFDGTMHLSQVQVTLHTNDGRVRGWTPIIPYRFEPIHFVHNEEKDTAAYVRCYPKRRTTKARVTYLLPQERLPLDETERRIEAYFPGVSMRYIKALIIATGCAEAGKGDIPILWATGPTEAAKTTTIRIVLEMYGESFQSMSEVPEDRLDQIFGQSLEKTRLMVFDDFAKEPENYRRFHTFIIRLNRSGHTYHKLHYGEKTVPVDSAVVLTDWRIPAFFSHDPQFGRRVHLIRLDNRLAESWSKLGRFVEGWWQSTPELQHAAQSLHSHLIDEFFPEGHQEPFDVKMARLGVYKLEAEVDQGEEKEALRDIVRKLVVGLGEATVSNADTEKRLGRGIQQVYWNTGNAIGKECAALCDSLGGEKQSAENLRHVLDPFQLELGKMFALQPDVARVEFDVKQWGTATFLRLVEGSKAKSSRAKRVNRELFTTWPPTVLDVPATPIVHMTTPVEDDMEPVVIVDDEPVDTGTPFIVYLDFETQSACELKKHGSYVYAEHPSTKIVCAAMQVEGRRIFWTEQFHQLVMPDGVQYEYGRDFLRDMVTDPSGCIIVAHNMEFERAMWTRCLQLPEPRQWYDTMDITLSKGLPGGADKAGEYLLGLAKDKAGYAHMMATCKPRKVRGKGMMMPVIDDTCVQKMLLYNFRDVEISKGIADRFGLDMNPAWEQQVVNLHHKINFQGLKIDKQYCQTLQLFDEELKEEAGRQVEKVTDGAILRTDLARRDFLMQALNENLPYHYQIKQLTKEVLQKHIDGYEDDADMQDAVDPSVIEVMKCRLIVTRAALAKVEKALDCISADGRAKAQIRYHAGHTGRFGGAGIQPQNMKRPDESFDIKQAIEAIETQDRERFRALCKDKPPYELLSSLVRGIFIPEPGNIFVSADFASIEARVLVWMAGDEAGLEEHRAADRGGPDVYCRLATTLYGREITKKDKVQRHAGKLGQLACGYQGGEMAVLRFATAQGLDFKAAGVEPQQIVDAFRAKYPRIRETWYACESAFRQVLTSRRSTTAEAARCIFRKYDDRVEIILPSGRALTYMNARLGADPRNQYRDTSILYDTAVKGHIKTHTIYGGLITENIAQAIARDLLVNVMLQTDEAGYDIPLHVHDELLVELPEDQAEECCRGLKEVMETTPSWGEGIPLSADPSIIRRYGK